jgi:hypothetical protein
VELAQLIVSILSLIALTVIGWATFRTERRSGAAAASDVSLRKVEQVVDALRDLQDAFDLQAASVEATGGMMARHVRDLEVARGKLRDRLNTLGATARKELPAVAVLVDEPMTTHTPREALQGSLTAATNEAQTLKKKLID